jgi:hypothetical protein
MQIDMSMPHENLDGGQSVSSWTLLTDGIIVVSVCASNKLL